MAGRSLDVLRGENSASAYHSSPNVLPRFREAGQDDHDQKRPGHNKKLATKEPYRPGRYGGKYESDGEMKQV